MQVTEYSRYVLSLIGAAIITACTGSVTVATSSPAPTSAFTKAFSPLDALTATQLVEVSELRASGHGGYVAQVEYAPDMNRVLAVYSDDGYVVGWDIDTAEVAFEYDLGIVSSRALAFSASGHILMGATEHVFKRNTFNQESEYVNGIGLWSMETGELIKCLTNPCQSNTSDRDGYVNALIDFKGRRAFVYSEISINILDLSGASGQLILFNDEDANYQWHLGSVAYDATHDRYILILQEGGIWLDTSKSSIFAYRTWAEGKQNDLRQIIAAKFDPAGHWLAFIRDNHLSVWQTAKRPESLYLEADVPNAVTLGFDQTGTLLFVGTSDKITIWDVANKTIVAEYDTPRLASLAISEDNRLLIWGDAWGKVHIWGAHR